MKINLEQVLVNVKGEALKEEGVNFTLGQALANILVSSNEGGKMKLWILAQKFYQGGEIEIDASDLALLKTVVSKSQAYNGSLVLGQVETLLLDIK